MTARIRSQSGNVITADFRPRAALDLTFTLKSETLYRDGTVLLTRTTALLGDQPVATVHFAGNLTTGHIVQL